MQSDAAGDFRVVLDSGTPDIVVRVRATGFRAAERTVRPGAGTSTPITVDFRLQPDASLLAPVRVVASRPKPLPEGLGRGMRPGEAGIALMDPGNDVNAGLSGDLADALAAVPGLSVTPDPSGGTPSISLAGLPSTENRVTLNGVAFSGILPRDAGLLRVFTSSYDPGKAMSGARASWTLLEGASAPTRRVRVTLDHPWLQRAPSTAVELGKRYTLPAVSGQVAGRIGRLEQRHNTVFDFSRRASEAPTLRTASPAVLEAFGVSPDSGVRLIRLLEQQGLSADGSSIREQQVTTRGTLFSRIELISPGTQENLVATPAGLPPGIGYSLTPPSRLLYAVVGGSWSESSGLRLGPTTSRLFGTSTRRRDAVLEVSHSAYLSNALLNETRSVLAIRDGTTTPGSALPSALVLNGSVLSDGSAAFASLQVAGSGRGSSRAQGWSWQTTHDMSWSTTDARHVFKLTLEAAADRYSQVEDAGAGMFRFNTIADVADARPAAFTRTLTTQSRSGTGWHGAFGIGDVFQPSRTLGIMYGLRAEGHRFQLQTAANPEVEASFGRRTDQVPHGLTIAPMAGFTWSYATLPGGFADQRRSLVGGIRDYRGSLDAQSLDASTRETGLPAGVQQIECVGGAVPDIAWSAWLQAPDAVPSRCRDGTLGTPFAQASPPVSVFAPNYQPSHSWRADLTWNHSLRNGLSVTASGMAAINLTQPSRFDLNFEGTPHFVLVSEGFRPVFAEPTSIAAATGAVSAVDSRRVPRFARVTEQRSDLRSEAYRLGAGFRYLPSFLGYQSGIRVPLSATYSWFDGRAQSNGFAATTAGDPRLTEWSAAGTGHHVVILSAALRIPDWFTLTAGAQLRSGYAYTPTVDADVNADGLVNDRAHVFDPATIPDSSLAGGMTSLLATAPPAARSCLLRQLRMTARQNSCRAPWSQTLNMSVVIDPRRLRFRQRGEVRLSVSNVLTALDELLHGGDRLRGWGQPVVPDATLLNVRGFDPAVGRFRYAVNPYFGSTAVARTAFYQPFRVTVDVRLDLGRDPVDQTMSERFLERVGDRVEVLDAADIKARLTSATQPNAFERVLRMADSLRLTNQQRDSLRAMSDRYDTARDSIYAELASYVGANAAAHASGATRRRYLAAIAQVGRAEWSFASALRRLLTEGQARVVFSPDGPLRGRTILMRSEEVDRYFDGWRVSPY